MKHTLYVWMIVATCLMSCAEKNGDDQMTGGDGNGGPIVESAKARFRVDTVASGLNNPWGIAFLPDGRILVTERGGTIRIVKDGKLLDEEISGVPAVFASGQGGLLDIQLHPD